MTASAGGYVFDIGKRFDPGVLPASLVVRGNMAGGLLLMAFGALWAAVVAAIAWPVIDEPMPMPLLPLAFLAVSVAVVAFGLRQALRRVAVTLDGTTVTIARRTWLNTRTASLPLSDYPGVLRTRVEYSRGKTRLVAWLAVLPHRDAGRRVVLAATHDEAEGRRLAERYAAWLGLPALEETADGFAARAPEDLDKPVAVQAAEGKLASDWRPDRTPPAEVRVESLDDRIVVSLMKGAVPLWFGALLAGGGAGFAFVFLAWGGNDAARVIGGAVGLIVLATVLWLAFRTLTTRRQIVLTRDRLAIVTLEGGEPRTEHDMALAEIEAVRIARGRLGGLVLAFDTDRGSFQTGGNMPRHALDYVRDLIVAALATARGGKGGGQS